VSVIVCVGGRWHGLQSRRQQFMLRFAEKEGHNVVFVEPSLSFGMKLRKRSDFVSPVFGYRSFSVSERMLVVSPPVALPLRHSSVCSQINHWRWARIVDTVLRKHKLCSTHCLWIYDPRWISALPHLSHKTLVFDMVDDTPAEGYFGGKFMHCVSELLKRADLVVFTSEKLVEKYGRFTSQNALVPNGYCSDQFRMGILPKPCDFPVTQGPVAIHIGTLFKHLDYRRMLEIAQELHQQRGVLLLVGNHEPDTQNDFAILLNHPAVHWLGYKKHDQINAYVSNSSVALSVFSPGPVSDSVSPLKLYEYLGCGVPTIVQGLTSFRNDPLYEFVYDLDYQSVKDALFRALTEQADIKRNRAREAERTASWDSRYSALRPFVENIL